MHRVKVLVFLLAISGSVFAQVYESFGPEDGIRLAEKLVKNPVISKDLPEPTPMLRYEMRIYVPEFNYRKPIKLRLIEVSPDVGDSRFYLYEVASDKLTKISITSAKPRKLILEALNESWEFVCSSAYGIVRVD
jgi:hypothetical protein